MSPTYAEFLLDAEKDAPHCTNRPTKAHRMRNQIEQIIGFRVLHLLGEHSKY